MDCMTCGELLENTPAAQATGLCWADRPSPIEDHERLRLEATVSWIVEFETLRAELKSKV